MTTTFNIEDIIAKRVSELDAAALRKSYIDQDEFVVVDDFLSPEIMAQWATQLESLKPHIHRNFIPKHKKGGSVDYNTVKDLGPADLTAMMIGEPHAPKNPERNGAPSNEIRLASRGS